MTFTPYAWLREGDEFIRVGGRPVITTGLPGERVGNTYFPSEVPASASGHKQGYDIHRMERRPGGFLDDVNLNAETHD